MAPDWIKEDIALHCKRLLDTEKTLNYMPKALPVWNEVEPHLQVLYGL